MNVVRLANYANRETLAVLEALKAKVLAGHIIGLALCYRTREGAEDRAITGYFAADTDRAAAAALRLSLELAAATGDFRESRL